jgi:hypothetical protein
MDNYQYFLLILFLLIFFHTTYQNIYEGENDVTVSRKRVVVFPLGSTFSVSYRNAYCNNIKLISLILFALVTLVRGLNVLISTG